jgi:hypothetical protein
MYFGYLTWQDPQVSFSTHIHVHHVRNPWVIISMGPTAIPRWREADSHFIVVVVDIEKTPYGPSPLIVAPRLISRDENDRKWYYLYENDCRSVGNLSGFIINLLISDYNIKLIVIWNSNFKYGNFLKRCCLYGNDTAARPWLWDFRLWFSSLLLTFSRIY